MKSKNTKMILLTVLVMMLWGSLFPVIKLSYVKLSVDVDSVSSIVLFAGLRFLICGIIICAISYFKKLKSDKNFKDSIVPMLSSGLFSVVLHYSLLYVGLSLTQSSKTSILKQLGTLFYICFCFLFVKEERFSFNKIIGAFLGFFGILAIGWTGGKVNFYAGDILIVGASFCTVFANLFSKKALKRNSPFLLTGVSQLFGGTVMVMFGLLTGGKLPVFNLSAIPVFSYICMASIVSYCLWNYVVANSMLSSLFIIKFSESVFACIFSATLLSESILKWQYFIAYILIVAGIIIGSPSKKSQHFKDDIDG